jgi:integrase
LRLKELSHLKWKDIDFVRHVIRVGRKKVKDGDNVVEFTPKNGLSATSPRERSHWIVLFTNMDHDRSTT